jgi:hypothetical protein
LPMPSRVERSLKEIKLLLSNSSEVPKTSTFQVTFMPNKELDQIWPMMRLT